MTSFIHKIEEREELLMKKSALAAIVLVFLIGLAVAALFLRPEIFQGAKESLSKTPAAKEGKPSGYQAVFLTNNQVYFGQLYAFESGNPILRDVYYLRMNQQPALQAPAAASDTEGKTKVAAPTKAATPQPELTLIKLGNELHGPTDEIKLNRDHILFVEDLKDDSKVVKAIRDYKEKNK